MRNALLSPIPYYVKRREIVEWLTAPPKTQLSTLDSHSSFAYELFSKLRLKPTMSASINAIMYHLNFSMSLSFLYSILFSVLIITSCQSYQSQPTHLVPWMLNAKPGSVVKVIISLCYSSSTLKLSLKRISSMLQVWTLRRLERVTWAVFRAKDWCWDYTGSRWRTVCL